MRRNALMMLMGLLPREGAGGHYKYPKRQLQAAAMLSSGSAAARISWSGVSESRVMCGVFAEQGIDGRVEASSAGVWEGPLA
jgi:hypothetical protein